MISIKYVFSLVLSVRDNQKEKQLYSAAKTGNLGKVKELLKTTLVDSDDNEHRYTPLIIAGKIFLYILCKWILIYNLTQ